jgi:hypothetical protein
VRILLSAGIPREHIRILSPTSTAERTSLTTPDAKRLAVKGGLWGALAGLLLGAVIFMLPKYIWDYPYENGLALVGMILFLGVGISVGVLQALMILRRQTGEHVIGPAEHGVFVTVNEDEEEKLNRAKDEFERFNFVHA